MSDDKNTRDGRDRSKVDINDSSEVEKVQQQFPNIQREQIIEAIKSAGPVRKDIYALLEKRNRR